MTPFSNSNVINALSLIEGHHKFIERNTGETNDSSTDLFLVNNEKVVSNNRHFIAWSQMEAQPNGDATTESQSLMILGYCYAYLATKAQKYLDAAEAYFNATITYFYKNQPIPTTPSRYICNWIVNGKEPIASNWAIDSVYPTHSGFKGVELSYTNGLTQVPSGSPYYGEYLDKATFAFVGALGWDAINATVYALKDDGTTDWDNSGEEYDVDWIIDWEGKKIDYNGDVLEENLPSAQYGSIQLKDTTINGSYKTNFAARLSEENGGYTIGRNDVQHNRPLHVPLLGDVTQMGNAADAEQWFADCAYLLWKITNGSKYKSVYDCVVYNVNAYCGIDAQDKFFRQSVYATTPFTDGISYDFTYPSDLDIVYGRDSNGYITIAMAESAQVSLEQQAVWFRVNQQSQIRTTFGGLGSSNGDVVRCQIQLAMSLDKQDSNPTIYGVSLQSSNSLTPTTIDISLDSLCNLYKSDGTTPYIIADDRAITVYSNCSYTIDFENNVSDTRSAAVANATFPDGGAGFIIGFWLQTGEVSVINSITYRSDADFDLRITDTDGWYWYWVLPATNNEWSTVTLLSTNLTLSSYQPNHPSDPSPTAPNYTTVSQLTIYLDDDSLTDKHFSYYCVNDIPPQYTLDDGYTLKYRVTLSCDEAFNAVLGDCTVIGFRDDSLLYTPGCVPYSNIYVEGSMQFDGWHGMPYPGYQYPFMFCHTLDSSTITKLGNMIDFLYDSQQWYNSQFSILGPVASAFIWDRWDNYKYGPANTWTMYNWGTDEAWAGYQPRAFFGAARAWYELVITGQTVPQKLIDFCNNWITFLQAFLPANQGRTPTEFPPTSGPTAPDGDFTGHMTGLFLAGCCHSALAGSTVVGLDKLIEDIFKLLSSNYYSEGDYTIMDGGWSPDVAGGMAYGFWSGEILRGLGSYILYHELPVGGSIYD